MHSSEKTIPEKVDGLSCAERRSLLAKKTGQAPLWIDKGDFPLFFAVPFFRPVHEKAPFRRWSAL
jgi:hypothetical protein